MLKISNLNVQYGNIKALKDISIFVENGELVTLIGSNGSGKTTTLKAISGLIKPKAGAIEFEDKRIDNLPPYKILELGIVHIPERRELFPAMTVMENLELGFYRTRGKLDFNKKLKSLINIFPILEKRKNQLAGTLSGGEQQMLAIGRGLMANPKVLMLDEPSLGLAPIMVNTLANVIKELHKEGMTILLVEQNAHMALNLADRAYVYETGKVVLEGPSQELLKGESVRKAFLGI